jgi:MYXO-CTERM domain-containing protein
MARLHYRKVIGIAVGLCVAAVTIPVRADIIDIYPSDSFEAAVESLNPGDTLIVHEGTYQDEGRISVSVAGTETEPVVITSADGEGRPHITRPASAAAQNTINVEGASYLTIRGLEISSNGGDGVNLNSDPSYITLEDLVIHDVDVGVNFRSDMHHITVRGCHIYDTGVDQTTGEGMYVGCNYSECVVRDSVIEGNWIHDTLIANQGDGIEIKRGSHSNIVRDNVIHDTNWPCVLLYGTDGNPRNIVEGNVMWNCGDSGIQAAADAVIRNNIILESPANGFNSQDHQEVTPENLEFVHNTVIGGSPCLRMNNWGGKTGLTFANNAVYCASDDFRISALDGVAVAGNVLFPATSALPSAGYTEGRSLADDFIDAAARNVYPSADSVLIDAGDPQYATAFDFNGDPRTDPPEAGAYAWTEPVNPGWTVQAGFKGSSTPPTTNGGGSGDGGCGCAAGSGASPAGALMWALIVLFGMGLASLRRQK